MFVGHTRRSRDGRRQWSQWTNRHGGPRNRPRPLTVDEEREVVEVRGGDRETRRGVRDLVGEIGRLVLAGEEPFERSAIEADLVPHLHLAVLGLDHKFPGHRQKVAGAHFEPEAAFIPHTRRAGFREHGAQQPRGLGAVHGIDVHGEDIHELGRVSDPAANYDVPARFDKGDDPLGIKLTYSGYGNRSFMYHRDIPSM